MCGRFTLTIGEDELRQLMPEFIMEFGWQPRYNVAPSQTVATVRNDGRRAITATRWGLVPSWAKDPAIGNRLINARAESLAEKPSFRGPFQRQRCLILADGFYEWQKLPGGSGKQPLRIRLKTGRPFALAGLWDRWRDPDGSDLLTSTIITTAANRLLEPVHDRMPVILPPAAWDRWLDPGPVPPDRLAPCLQPYPPEEMEAYPVSPLVNSPAHDEPACIQPVTLPV